MTAMKIFSIFVIFVSFAFSDVVQPKKLWKSGINARFANMTNDQRKMFLGAQKLDNVKSTFPKSMLQNAGSLPDSFNAYDKWGYCKDSITTVRDQSACGSCWAVAAAAGMSDLACIKSKGRHSPYLSEEDLISCCPTCGDCEQGGNVAKAFDFWQNKGLVTGGSYRSHAGCQPYTIPPLNDLGGRDPPPMPFCDYKCQSSYTKKDYHDDKHTGNWTKYAQGADEMKLAIYNYGPIVITHFYVYEDFQTDYKGGIYNYNGYSRLAGGHAAKVIGWGRENGEAYWLAVNSWGTDWGDDGFYKMKLGTNECGFEELAAYGESDNYDEIDPPRSETTTSSVTETTKISTPVPTTQPRTHQPRTQPTTTQAPVTKKFHSNSATKLTVKSSTAWFSLIAFVMITVLRF